MDLTLNAGRRPILDLTPAELGGVVRLKTLASVLVRTEALRDSERKKHPAIAGRKFSGIALKFEVVQNIGPGSGKPIAGTAMLLLVPAELTNRLKAELRDAVGTEVPGFLVESDALKAPEIVLQKPVWFLPRWLEGEAVPGYNEPPSKRMQSRPDLGFLPVWRLRLVPQEIGVKLRFHFDHSILSSNAPQDITRQVTYGFLSDVASKQPQYRLHRGYSDNLKSAGFPMSKEGHNCLTNGSEVLIPLQNPTPAQWDHPLLAPIRGLKTVPADEWLKYLDIWEKQPATLIGEEVVEDEGLYDEKAEPKGKGKGSKVQRRDVTPYRGPRDSTEFYGRWLVYKVGKFYLVEMPRYGVAVQVFDDRDKALRYTKGLQARKEARDEKHGHWKGRVYHKGDLDSKIKNKLALLAAPK